MRAPPLASTLAAGSLVAFVAASALAKKPTACWMLRGEEGHETFVAGNRHACYAEDQRPGSLVVDVRPTPQPFMRSIQLANRESFERGFRQGADHARRAWADSLASRRVQERHRDRILNRQRVADSLARVRYDLPFILGNGSCLIGTPEELGFDAGQVFALEKAFDRRAGDGAFRRLVVESEFWVLTRAIAGPDHGKKLADELMVRQFALSDSLDRDRRLRFLRNR